jgi:hypothetical protein
MKNTIIHEEMVTVEGIVDKTEYPFQIFSDNMALVDEHKARLKTALNIVDAQFYYTNPLLFVILKDASALETSKWSPLWKNYYLTKMDIGMYLDRMHPVMLANQTFIEQVGSIQNIIDNLDTVRLQHEKGLFVVAILPE